MRRLLVTLLVLAGCTADVPAQQAAAPEGAAAEAAPVAAADTLAPPAVAPAPGRWEGTLHADGYPDQKVPVSYLFSEGNEGELELELFIIAPPTHPAHDLRVEADTVYFSFVEPDADVPLDCVLGWTPLGEYAGRCYDPEGKFAVFIMRPPEAE